MRRGFDQLVNSLYAGEAGDFVNYPAVKGTIPANFRQSIVQAYDSIPEYLQDGLDADVAGQVVNDLRNNPSLASDPDIALQSVRNVQPPARQS